MKMQFGNLKLEQLMRLKAQLEAEIHRRLDEERQRLQASLDQLDTIAGAVTKGRDGRKTVLPKKYRNPENLEETWAGRGLRPRWLVAALKSGKRRKLSDFEIKD